MIADLAFGRSDARGVRAARFVPRSSIPLAAACLVAGGVRETLRELFGRRCEVTLGEPVPLGHGAWLDLTRDALCFLTRGRQTDAVLVLAATDARALVRRAFGEADAASPVPCSALELAAIDRIAARCATAFDPLCAERRGGTHRLEAGALPDCVAFFDVRVQAPVALTLGIGIVRDLPDPGPGPAIRPAALAGVPLRLSAVVGTASVSAHRFLALRTGDVVRLDAKVGSLGALNVGDQRIAAGACGVAGARHAFAIHHVDGREVGP
ncbi:MAG: FliM/FliN family flagellar motor switch protein [Candidatus Velthaea sp.]